MSVGDEQDLGGGEPGGVVAGPGDAAAIGEPAEVDVERGHAGTGSGHAARR